MLDILLNNKILTYQVYLFVIYVSKKINKVLPLVPVRKFIVLLKYPKFINFYFFFFNKNYLKLSKMCFE